MRTANALAVGVLVSAVAVFGCADSDEGEPETATSTTHLSAADASRLSDETFADLKLRQAQILVAVDEPARALQEIDQLLTVDGIADAVVADTLRLKGFILHTHDRLERALEAYEGSLGYEPDHIDALEAVAVILEKLERYSQAIRFARKVADADPERDGIDGLLNRLDEQLEGDAAA